MAKKAPLNPKQLRLLVNELQKKLKQNFKKQPKKMSAELKKLVDNFNTKSSGCKLGVKDLQKEMKNPRRYTKADWDKWAGKHKGTWNKDGQKSSQDNATWQKAKQTGKQITQEVEWHSHKRPLGYNITYKDGVVGGLDPKPGNKHMWEHLGLPFNVGECCQFILWVVWLDPRKTTLTYFLEGIDCEGTKVSVTVNTKKLGYGLWKVKK